MSSAMNHARRSHRSELTKKAVFGTSARRMYIRQAQKPKRFSFFKSLGSIFHRSKTEK